MGQTPVCFASRDLKQKYVVDHKCYMSSVECFTYQLVKNGLVFIIKHIKCYIG